MSVIKKITIFILAALSACMFACGGTKDPTNPNDPSNPNNPTEQANILNGFETMQDLYNIMWMNIGYNTVGKVDINKDPEYVKDGEGSLVLSVTNHNWPELYFAKEQTNNPQMTVSDIKSVSVWIYNATDETKVATLNVCASGLSHLLSEQFELPAKEWKECVLNVNAVVTKYAGESVIGFSIQFQTKGEQKFYIDSLSAEYGATLSAEDLQIVSDIESITEAINNLPETPTAENESTFSSVYDRYNALPDIYKSAVSNYSKLGTAMSGLVVVRNKAEEAKDTAAINRPVFYFDSFYGMSMLSTVYDTRVNFSYSKDIKLKDEAGSTVIGFTGDVWNYINFSNTVSLKEYDYIEFAIYNDGLEKAVWLSNDAEWSNRKQIKTGEWVSFSVPVTDLKDTGSQFVVTTSVDGGEAAMTDGNLYISQIKAIKLGANEMYSNALENDGPISATGATVTQANGKTTVTANADGEVTLNLHKKEASISVAQQVAFAFNSPSSLTLTLNGANGSVSVAEGNSTVVLTAAQYNSVTSISINAQKGDVFEISKFYISRTTDAQGMKLIIEKDFLPELSAWTKDDLPQAIEYMSIYNDKELDALQKQFIKVNEAHELYNGQKAEYDAIVEVLNARAEKIKAMTEALIDSIDLSKENAEEIYLFNNVYTAYKAAVRLAAIDSSKTAKAAEIIAKLEYLPYRVVDVSSSADRSKFSLVTEFFSWTGSVAATKDSDYGTVMGVTPTSFVADTNVELSYDNTSVPSGYDYVHIKVFSPNTSRTLWFITYGWGKTVTKFSLAANAWTDVYISVSDYRTAESMLLSEMVVGETVKFCDILAYNEKYVENVINELPEPDAITLANAAAVKAAQAHYDRLSTSSKKKVSNVEKLDKCMAKIVSLSIAALDVNMDMTVQNYLKVKSVRAEYDALSANAKTSVTDADKNKLTTIENKFGDKFAVIFDMSDISGFSFSWSGDGLYLSKGYDDTYGNYLKVTSDAATGDYRQITINYLKDGLAEKLKGCDKVYFYVYHEYTGSDSVHYDKTLLTNFGGASAYPDTDGYTTAYKGIDLKWGEWTLVGVPVQEFLDGTFFGIYNVWTASEFKFSMFYATKYSAEEAAKTVTDKINALPSAEALTGLDGAKISAARTAYDELSTEAKALVTNYGTLTAIETAYNSKYAVVFDMNDISVFSVNPSYDNNGDGVVTFSKGTDVEKGNYLNVQLNNATHDQLAILYPKTDLDTKLAGCDKVYFYVWNGETADRGLFANFGGTANTYYKTLSKDEWILVEVPVEDFKSGSYFGFSWVNGCSGTYKFSMFWATKTAQA